MQRYESFENPLAGQSFGYEDDDQVSSSSGNVRFGSALYDFTAGGDDEVNGFKLLTLDGFAVLLLQGLMCSMNMFRNGLWSTSVWCAQFVDVLSRGRTANFRCKHGDS